MTALENDFNFFFTLQKNLPINNKWKTHFKQIHRYEIRDFLLYTEFLSLKRLRFLESALNLKKSLEVK